MKSLPKYEYETCAVKVDTLPPGTDVEIECIHTGKFVTGKLFQIVGVSYNTFEVDHIKVVLYNGIIGKLLKKR